MFSISSSMFFCCRFDFATAQRLSPSITDGVAALGVNRDGVPTFAAEVRQKRFVVLYIDFYENPINVLSSILLWLPSIFKII